MEEANYQQAKTYRAFEWLEERAPACARTPQQC